MVIQSVNQINTDICIGNFQLKCVLEVLRASGSIEAQLAVEALEKHGFKYELNDVMAETKNFITTVGRFMDGFQKIEPQEEPEPEYLPVGKPSVN